METSDESVGQQSESLRNLRLAPTAKGAASPERAGQTDLISDGGHLLDYLGVLHKRRWTAGTAFLLVLVSVTTYTFTVTPIYEAKTRLLIEADGPNVINFTEVIDEQRTKADYYQTQYNILQSRLLARKTIESLKLWDSSYLGGDLHTGFLATLLGYGTTPPKNGQNVGETLEQSRAVDRFLDNLTVSPIRNSRLVDVKFESPDPNLSADVANALREFRGKQVRHVVRHWITGQDASHAPERLHHPVEITLVAQPIEIDIGFVIRIR